MQHVKIFTVTFCLRIHMNRTLLGVGWGGGERGGGCLAAKPLWLCPGQKGPWLLKKGSSNLLISSFANTYILAFMTPLMMQCQSTP